jgi:hypothetical protein
VQCSLLGIRFLEELHWLGLAWLSFDIKGTYADDTAITGSTSA